MDIKRDRYLQRIIARKHNGFVKVITGIRRCGKSYLLFNLFRKHLADDGVDDRHVIGVNLEDKEFAFLRNPNKLFDYITERIPVDGKWTYVFIDEIQMCRKVLADGVKLRDVAPEDIADAYITFYDILNSLMKKPNVDVYYTTNSGLRTGILRKIPSRTFFGRSKVIPLWQWTYEDSESYNSAILRRKEVSLYVHVCIFLLHAT